MRAAMTRIDRLLGRITMYLLIVGVLGVLTLLALVLALADAIAIDPLAILVSAVVLTAASWIANQVLGLIFKYLENKKKRLDQEQLNQEQLALEQTASKALPTFDSKEYTDARAGENAPDAAPARD